MSFGSRGANASPGGDGAKSGGSGAGAGSKPGTFVSTGNRLLDKRAAAIARNAGPFGAFTAGMRRQADQIVVVSRFKFTRDETLEANVAARP